MTWEEVCAHPSLPDLPFMLELNEYGQIVMSPASDQHSLYQARPTRLLMQYLEGGETLTECAVETSKGTKVADVVWASSILEGCVTFYSHEGPRPQSHLASDFPSQR